MNFSELNTNNQLEISIIVAAAHGHKWESLTEDSKSRYRDTIRRVSSELDGGQEVFVGIEATAANELRKLHDYRASANIKVEVEAPLPQKAAPKPIKRGNK